MSSALPRYWHSVAHKEKIEEALRECLDVHSHVASWFFDVPIAEVTPTQRALAKDRNYHHLYGVKS